MHPQLVRLTRIALSDGSTCADHTITTHTSHFRQSSTSDLPSTLESEMKMVHCA